MFLAFCGSLQAQLSEFVQGLRILSLDAQTCYHVRDVALVREDIRLFFTDGYLIFTAPVQGRRLGGVFTADLPGGDAEILVFPPTRGERLSLATFTGSPNLNEHFDFALMIFTDDTADRLLAQMEKQGVGRCSDSMAGVLQERWGGVVRNFIDSFLSRILHDLLSAVPAQEGFFYAALRGKRLGGFDVVHDPLAPESIQLGQVQSRANQIVFDVWARFPGASVRRGERPPPELPVRLEEYFIQATLAKDLSLRCVTRARLKVARRIRALAFDLSSGMQVTRVTIDGVLCEHWQRPALRADLLHGAGVVLVVAPFALEPGKDYSIEFEHMGNVVSDAGNGVYYVGARGHWYPRVGVEFANYEVCFRYPESLYVVFPGQLVSERAEGEWRVVCRRTESPVRLLGFNVGDYEYVEVPVDNARVEVYANRRVEQALEPRPSIILVPQEVLPGPRRRQLPTPAVMVVPTLPAKPDPTARMKELADEIAEAFSFMREILGPPPSQRLAVSPIPGTFGQGFPGLLYLSTLAYLAPEERPKAAQEKFLELFFSEILHAHEVAHQWWGNVVTAASYRDEWLMEALANYMALMLLERRRGPEVLRTVLQKYKERLLQRDASGQPLESSGPISWGERLNSSRAEAWRIITYEKGSWIIHMLRCRLGDEAFKRFLGELTRRYRYRPLSVEDFRKLAAEFLPRDYPDQGLEQFFEQWVEDVGIARLRCSYRVRGKAPRIQLELRVEQHGVPDHYSVDLPVEIELADGRLVRRWLRTSNEPVTVTLTLSRPVRRVTFNPNDATLAVLE